MSHEVTSIERIRAFLVLAATIGMIVFNWLAAAGYVFGVTPAEISDRYPTVVTPAGYAFTIWSLIYLGLVVFSIYQLLPRNIPRFVSIRSLYILSCAFNCAWIFFWHGNQIGISLGVIAALFIVLVLINLRLRNAGSAIEAIVTKGPFGLYLGWVTAASLVNFAIFLVFARIDMAGSDTILGASLVLAAAAFGVFARVKMGNYVVPAAVAWALTAIAVKQSGRTLIVAAAAAGVVACLIAALSFVVNLPSREPVD